ncbi:hypothetical protein [Streptomyces sp. NPDC002324]
MASTTPRADLDKRPATYYLLTDDEGAGRTPGREVVHIERASDDPAEAQAQWDAVVEITRHAPAPLNPLTVTAASHGHAVWLARTDHAIATAAALMAETIEDHRSTGTRGCAAIRIASGGSDGQLYADADAARAAQDDPDGCTYIAISPLLPWSVRMCEDHLRHAADLKAGRVRICEPS